MMDTDVMISDLEREWTLETGFLGLLRTGFFDAAAFDRLQKTLDKVKIQADSVIDRRLVSLLWYMPAFMEWQRQRVEERGGDLIEVDRAINQVRNALARILGVP